MARSEALKDRVALVTGGTQGIGRAVAREFLEAGAVVAVTGRDRARAEEAARALSAETGARCLGFGADVARAAEVEVLFAELLDKTGRLDILVNNAGVTRDSLLLRMSEADWDAVLDTNLKGAFLCSKAACRPLLKAKGGSIINVSSVVGLCGNEGQANYAACKAGLVGFTKSLAKELASRSIRVNVVAPGFIETAMTAELDEAARRDLIARIPLGRFAQPEEVAAACAFLAGDGSRYVTGQVLRVDGGMMM